MINSLKILFMACLVSCSIVSCTDAESQLNPELLVGHWELIEGSRNGKVTSSLVDLFFIFKEDGSMETNLLGTTEQGNYELTGMELIQKNTKMDASYQLETLNDSLLIMSTSLRNTPFTFKLGRLVIEE